MLKCNLIKLYLFLFSCSSLVVINLALAKPESQLNSVCPKEQLYLHRQQPIKINNNCKLQSTFYFKNVTKGIEPLKPINNNFKTRLNIPKAKID